MSDDGECDVTNIFMKQDHRECFPADLVPPLRNTIVTGEKCSLSLKRIDNRSIGLQSATARRNH